MFVDDLSCGSRANLLRMGVTHILNVAKQVENACGWPVRAELCERRGRERCWCCVMTHVFVVAVPMSFIYKKIAMVDSPDQDPAKHFSSAIKFIDDARNNGGVCFVHCVAGTARLFVCACTNPTVACTATFTPLTLLSCAQVCHVLP